MFRVVRLSFSVAVGVFPWEIVWTGGRVTYLYQTRMERDTWFQATELK